jgi:hypothetical protein
MPRDVAGTVRRAARKPPRVLARRGLDEARAWLDAVLAPRQARRLGEAELLELTEAAGLDALWQRLAGRSYPFVDDHSRARLIGETDPTDRERILAAAEDALTHRVDLLGSGPVDLGTPIDWRRDPKTGRTWPLEYGRRLDYANRAEPSDVKLPWEISRVQWLLPAGQAYLLTGEERYAAGVRDVLADWIAANPYPLGPNWALAMEPALRILSWTWLFRACRESEAFANRPFRLAFLRALYLHGLFVSRNLERSDVNGNHLTADAAGLVFCGLFFGDGKPAHWAEVGWDLLATELPRQVHRDGVDFEASSAYHRLVAELFLLPALYRLALGLEVGTAYRRRLGLMAAFTAAYTGPDGLSPLWGDADDGRALPLGGQELGDHRYLPGLIGAGLGVAADTGQGGPRSELSWLLGPAAALPDARPLEARPQAFRDAGVYVLAGGADHVFVDCGPVGLAGRGGHGHNDCLGFEAVLDGVRVVSDAGSYVYTASPEWRNRFRGTAFHNTPQVDGAEQNRIPASLWLLDDDARPEVQVFEERGETVVFRGSHTGYERLADPVRPVRTIALHRGLHALLIDDAIEAAGSHRVEIPLLLAPAVEAHPAGNTVELAADGRAFTVEWSDSDGWTLELGSGWISPSYGVRTKTARLAWRRTGRESRLTVTITPAGADPGALAAWRAELLAP